MCAFVCNVTTGKTFLAERCRDMVDIMIPKKPFWTLGFAPVFQASCFRNWAPRSGEIVGANRAFAAWKLPQANSCFDVVAETVVVHRQTSTHIGHNPLVDGKRAFHIMYGRSTCAQAPQTVIDVCGHMGPQTPPDTSVGLYLHRHAIFSYDNYHI